MSEIPGRLFRIAKNYLDEAKGRVSEISENAQEELTRALDRSDIKAGLASPDDPMARAQAKIVATRGETTAWTESRPAIQTPTDPIQTAYRIIGVPAGSDYLTVQTAVNKLRERCAPSRFPNGSIEQSQSQTILQKVEEAYQILQTILDPGAGRFDRLEL